MPQNTQNAYETMKVRDRNNNVVVIYKKNLPEAMKRGAKPVLPEMEGKTSIEQQDEGTLTKVGRGAALGAAEGAGIPETMHPIEDLLSGLKNQTGELLKRLPEESIKFGGLQGAATAEAVRMAKDIAQKALTTGKSAIGNSGLGMNGIVPSFNKKRLDPEGLSHDLSSLVTQIFMLKGGKEAAETPLAKSELVRGGKAVAENAKGIPPSIVQSVTGAKSATNKAERLATEEAAKKTSEFEKAKAEREAEIAEQRRIKEERDRAAQEEFERKKSSAIAEAKNKDVSATREQIAETKKKAAEFKKNLDEKKAAEAKNAQIEKQRNSLQNTVVQKAKQFTANIDKAVKYMKESFDSEYDEFDKRVLGKTKQLPKGTVKADLTKFAQSVEAAKKNIVEGSPESIKQFETILNQALKGDGSEAYLDEGGGKLGIPPGKELTAVDLRGFITELNGKIYDGNLLPDVRNAAKAVVESGKDILADAVEKAGGEPAVKYLKDLNARYSDYLTDWRDTSSVNPLPKLRNKLLEGVTTRNPDILNDLDLTKGLKGDSGGIALKLLKKYEKFGVDPSILEAYRKAVDQLKALEKTQKVPDVKKPTYPEPSRVTPFKPPKPPQVEPFTPRGNDPTPPEIQPFNRQAHMRNVIDERLNAAGKIGQGFKLLKGVSDIIHRNVGGAMSEAEQMAVIEAVRRLLTSDRSLDYLSKEKGAI